jgi:ribose transport system ATP-binding protein
VDRSTTPVLALESVSTALGHQGIDLEAYAGEIHGLYGLVGAGRSELVRCLLGLDPVTGGRVLLDGQARKIRNMGDALNRYRVGYVTENRKEEGLFLELPVRHNVSVTVWRRLARAIRGVSKRTENEVTSKYVRQLDIRATSNEQLAGTLSGGNQQKVSLAKWLAVDPRLLIIDEPTVGVDVRTKGDFHDLIFDLADRGVAIVLISSDLPEMVTLADRVSVMSNYRLVGTIDNSKDYPTMSRRIMDAIHETVHVRA